jgi:hypothetical protein
MARAKKGEMSESGKIGRTHPEENKHRCRSGGGSRKEEAETISVTAQAQPPQMQGNARPNGKAATLGNGRWNKRRLNPKDPEEAAKELTNAIDALFDHLGMRTEAERQEEEFKNAARTHQALTADRGPFLQRHDPCWRWRYGQDPACEGGAV